MCIHSILPVEAYQEAAPQPQAVCKSCRYGFVDCVTDPDGRYRVRRVISTDPAAYLDPAFQPDQSFYPSAQ